MLSEEQIIEIREHLERAQNPVFFYDNDADGLCSYVLLRRFLGRGKGVAIRTKPEIDKGYARKIQEFNADCVFILDKPIIGKAFVDEIKGLGIPMVWIDHHDLDESYDGIFSYNSAKNKSKSAEPVTCVCYKVVGERKEDIWIALMGCVSDNFMPDFLAEFSERYPDFSKPIKEIKIPFDIYYKTEIGFLIKALSFGLKDSVTHVVQLQNFFISCKSPQELVSFLDSGSSFGKKYREVRSKYDSLLKKARMIKYGKVIFFKYGGDLSISAELSNELMYTFPKKIVAVAYDNGGMANISLRGDNVKDILEKVIGKFEGASGGGHRDAVGARIKSADLDKFKNELNELFK